MTKIRGTDIYVEVNTGTEETPTWIKVGGQGDATLTRSMGTIDVTDKDSQGWEEVLIGNRTAELEFDAFLIEDDAGFEALETAFEDRTEVDLRLTTPTQTYRGKFILTEFPIEAPKDDSATISFTLKANGAIAKAPRA